VAQASVALVLARHLVRALEFLLQREDLDVLLGHLADVDLGARKVVDLGVVPQNVDGQLLGLVRRKAQVQGEWVEGGAFVVVVKEEDPEVVVDQGPTCLTSKEVVVLQKGGQAGFSVVVPEASHEHSRSHL
jgi:hypothetical protein